MSDFIEEIIECKSSTLISILEINIVHLNYILIFSELSEVSIPM